MSEHCKECERAMIKERQRCAELVRTWANDHLTVQPTFTRLVAAILAGPTIARAERKGD